jgi:hypothetical protein
MGERLLTGAALSLVAAFTAQPLTAAPGRGDSAERAGCRMAVERRLAAWGAGVERYRDADGPLGAREWRLPTREIGAVLGRVGHVSPPCLVSPRRSTVRLSE